MGTGIITQSVLDALRTTIDTKWTQTFESTPTWYDQLCTDTPSNAKSNTYGFKAQSTALRQWLGPRVAQNLQEHDYVLVNQKYEATVELSRDEIADDSINVFATQTIPDLAEATRKHPDSLLASVISTNPNCYDGLSFFNTAHPNYNRSGSGATTFSNDQTASGGLTATNYATVRASMRSRIGENGLPLMVNAGLLIVPPALEYQALTIMQSATYAVPNTTGASATVDNVLRGMSKVLVVPELEVAPTVWYLADVTRAVKPFVHQLRDPAELIAMIDPSNPKVFDLDVFTWGVRVRRNVGVTLPHLITRVTND
jgi:phage major head subunit gpT-like protein